LEETSKQHQLKSSLENAVRLHGHLGPFLVIGVRMGIIGIRELGLKNDDELRVTAHLKYSIPISCVVDGLQVTTRCTIGNQKLKLIDSSDIAAKFILHNGKEVAITVNPAAYDKLKSQLLSEKNSPKEVGHLAKQIASISEEDLFIIGRNF
jgi:formylmethanofuran dehydrogenase subunit E